MVTRSRIRCALGALAVLGTAWVAPAVAKTIGALGRIVPENGIVTLVGLPGTTIEKILVEPDQVVKAGDPLVEFAGKDTFEIELAMAEQAREDLVTSGTKSIEIQRATLAQLRASSKQAEAVEKLEQEGAAEAAQFAAEVLARLLKSKAATYSANLRAEKEHHAENTRIALAKAKAQGNQAQAQYRNNIRLAELELERRKIQNTSSLKAADLKIALAREKVAKATLHAPSDGTILEILHHEGESSSGPLLRLADLSRMSVRMMVFQADVLALSEDMKATISSKSLPEKLLGKITRTGREITDAGRVVPVMIRLENAEVAERLLNLEVQVSLTDGR